MFKCERKRGRDLKTCRVSSDDNEKKTRGRVVDNQQNPAVIDLPELPALAAFDRKVLQPKGFTIEDILWAVGIWSVLFTMSPVIFFYMLMVA